MEFVTKSTFELSKIELLQIKDLFEEVFEKPSSVDFFVKYYTGNFLGYSFHSLIIKEGRIVGVNSLVPIIYMYNGEKMRFVNAGGTMISKRCRGLENFYDMINESFRFLKEKGFAAYVGFPNDASYSLYIGTKLQKDIGKLYTYILPYKLGNVKKSLCWLNSLSKLFCWGYVYFNGLLASMNVTQFIIHKDHDSFDQYRYNNPSYKQIEIGGCKAFYIVKVHERVRTAFIIDITEKSAKNFQKTVKEIIKREKSNMDMILYVGNLPFRNHGLIKLPRKFEPKNFHFTGHIIDHNLVNKDIFYNLDNWDVNLSNYDLV